MKKRKQSGNGDLRTNPLSLSLHKYTNLGVLRPSAELYWNAQFIQPFFPPIECLFKSEKLEYPNEYGFKFGEEIQTILSPSKVRIADGSSRDVHIKSTMLVSPFKWMQGNYGTNIGLPTTSENSEILKDRIQNPNNAAYVGALVSSVLSESGCVHFPKVYGVFTGISKHHKIDISDDYSDLSDRPWFSKNIGKTFELSLSDEVKESEFQHTRTARASIQIGEDATLGNIEELVCEKIEETTVADIKKVFEDEEISSNDDSSSSVSTSYIFNINSCDCDDEDREIMDEESEGGDSFAWATFTNVPVQMTIMEKCDGTLFELMTSDTDPDKHLAWISQVIFGLAYAQRNFGFVHNDLHSNNVLYVKTSKEFLYYNWSGFLYKIPTYGYIIKIIDFERGLTSIKLTGMKEPKFFMSHHFDSNDEAGGQYNYPPFNNSKFPEVKPNPSFDLVRLATSLFWDLYPLGPTHEEYKKIPTFCLFTKWLTLEDGSSVLFGKEDPQHDRYHGFTLYKAIARYCKDTAVPKKELINLKSFYEVPNVPAGETALNIDI